jgi:hypothetical protein
MDSPIDLRIVIFREGDFWLAQGLEHDLGVQAENLKDLMMRLAFLLAADPGGVAALPAAPVYFQHLWPHRAGAFAPDDGFVADVPSQIRLTFAMVA